MKNFPKGPKSNIKLWLEATRPKTLAASVGPVLLGISLSYSYFPFHASEWFYAFLILFCTLFMQIGANLVNDYHDHFSGVDGIKRFGPKRLTSAGLISPSKIKNAYQFCFITAFLLGLPLIARGGFPIFIVGITSLLFAYAYTGGPFPLSHFGMGEILAFIFFGPIAVGGTCYLETFQISSKIFFCGIGPGLITATIMAINNLRDRESDQQANKNTFAVIFGESNARLLCVTLIVGAGVVPLLLIYVEKGSPLLFVTALTPFVFINNWTKILNDKIGIAFNEYLAQTGKFLLLYCLTFSLGILW